MHIIIGPMEAGSLDIAICPMSEADLDAVLEIEEASFPRPWSRAHFIAELESPHSFPFVAFNESGRIVGYICMMQILDEGHVLDVAVHPEWKGKGIGRFLVQRGLQECRLRGAEFVSLEVRASNSGAIALYQQLGFKQVGVRKRYYENGEDAIMMEYIFSDKESGSDAV